MMKLDIQPGGVSRILEENCKILQWQGRGPLVEQRLRDREEHCQNAYLMRIVAERHCQLDLVTFRVIGSDYWDAYMHPNWQILTRKLNFNFLNWQLRRFSVNIKYLALNRQR